MTLEETGIIMDILKIAYPRFYSGSVAPDGIQALSLWAEMFADDDVALVAAAVKTFIAEDRKGFAPCIGEIKNIMLRLTQQSSMDEDQAWELIRRAASRSGYDAQEEYNRLPKNLQRMCSPGQLYEWSQMDSEVFNSVIGSHFRKSYRVHQESFRRNALLPADVKRVISDLTKRLALEDGASRTLPISGIK